MPLVVGKIICLTTTLRTEPAGNLIYAIGNGSLFSYDKEDTSIQCYWKGNLLSDTDISYIAYNKEYKNINHYIF